MPWTADILRTTPIEIVIETPDGLRRVSVDEARTLRDALTAAIDAATPKVERSCFTCRHNDFPPKTRRSDCVHPDRFGSEEYEIDEYCASSGCADARDGMPTDRTIPCPGHAPKDPA